MIGICSAAFSSDLFSPIPLKVDYDKQKARIGEKLFSDTILSKDNTLSCSKCHNLSKGGVDGLPTAIGVGNKVGLLNTPTVFNARFNISQNWNGSAKTLHEQAAGPITGEVEMCNNFDTVIKRLNANKEYTQMFNGVYKQGITKETILESIGEFEKGLVTPNSRFDKFLRGDNNALSNDEKEGFELFKKKGCASCHNGVNMGGNMYQKIGVMVEYNSGAKWLGRYSVTKDENDKFFIKVPTLRNITLTAPYFHDGSVPNLKKAVELMLFHQLGEKPREKEVVKIIKFLGSLEGQVDGSFKK